MFVKVVPWERVLDSLLTFEKKEFLFHCTLIILLYGDQLQLCLHLVIDFMWFSLIHLVDILGFTRYEVNLKFFSVSFNFNVWLKIILNAKLKLCKVTVVENSLQMNLCRTWQSMGSFGRFLAHPQEPNGVSKKKIDLSQLWVALSWSIATLNLRYGLKHFLQVFIQLPASILKIDCPFKILYGMTPT